MGKKSLAYHLELIKSLGHKQEWLKAKRYGETTLKKLTLLTYSPNDEYILYCRLGYIYDILADYSRSLDSYYKAQLTASRNKLKESHVAYAAYMIGKSFIRIKNIDQALLQLKKVSEYYQKYGCDTELMNKERFITHLMDFAYYYMYKNELDKAKEIIQEKLTAYRPFNSENLSLNYCYLNSEYLIAANEYDKARESTNEFIALNRKSNLIRNIFEGKMHLAVIDLLEGKLDSAIKDLLNIFKETGKEKYNDIVCAAGLLLSKCYNLKNLADKSADIEKRIKPIISKLNITWMYEQIRDFEDLYRKLEPIYHNKRVDSIPAVLGKAFYKHNELIGYKERIIGESRSMQETLQLAEKIAPTDLPVLIQGETGTGKELIAKTIHLNSLRNRKPWLALNCASIPESLLGNELFGHVKGAFTDAKEDRKGYIESASKGTLFLDEISEMSLPMQQKLLRVLEEKQLWRVGAEKPIPIDTRFIFASNRNIEELVANGLFRKDLYYRINTIVITLPPLRDRKDDIPLLINHFLTKYANHRPSSVDFHGASLVPRVPPDALRLLTAYPWPGNVRELENEIKRMCALHSKVSLITEEMISESMRKSDKGITPSGTNLKDLTDDFQRKTIEQTIRKCNGNLSEAARLLGYDRANLNRKIKQLNILLPKP